MKPRVFRVSHLRFVAAFALMTAVIPLGGAVANHGPISYRSLPDETVTPITSPTATFSGSNLPGTNAQYDFVTGEPCNHPNPLSDPDPDKCDIFLLHVDLSEDPNFWVNNGGGVEVTISNYTPNAASDFDMQAFVSDAAGTKTTLLAGSSGALAGMPETFTIPNASGYYLVQIAYFAVPVPSNFSGTIRFVSRARFPADTDAPPGLQEVLASDPAQGWTSRSEMHIAQNPMNPSMLIAGSKFYNKDSQALAQYEFKVGSYVSFTRGRSWIDLGQVRTCPMAASPPSVWFTPAHTCYPEDNPALDDEFGEQYITSDPWVGWDDDGNAYFMLLDSPPFPITENGWGMTLHRWDSVSQADVTSGTTWGPRLPISEYRDDQTKTLFLDDKNTFAVNNAGPSGGDPSTIVACWGKNVPDVLKQAEVCVSSADRGETWSPEIPVNDVEQLGIGINVVADKFDPNTFYAAYLQYVTSTGAVGPSTVEFNKSIDGGLTWLPVSTTVAAIDDIPRQFPGQSFRNLSIPIMAAGNQVGTPAMSELYITWAEERPIGSSTLKEAEIAIVRSDNAGTTWNGLGTFTPVPGSAHVKIVNGPDNNRDQFQPYVDVTPLGQVNVFYFDRRHDISNYYVDSFLSRSNNRGVTFTDHRLSHDATDPEFNAPQSPSGAFFGDYQGLVVDNCFAYPFVNDTHLANDAFLDPNPTIRDPDYDGNPPLPDSPYQEAISWRVPNINAFGGDNATFNRCLSRPTSLGGTP